MDNNRPRGRERNVTGPGKTVQKRGEGLGGGPVGEAGRGSSRQTSSGTRSTGTRRVGGIQLIVLLLVALLGGGGGLAALRPAAGAARRKLRLDQYAEQPGRRQHVLRLEI